MRNTVKPIDHKQLLMSRIRLWEEQYDSEVHMLKLPFHSPGYHTNLSAAEFPLVHPTYPTLVYALSLLDSEVSTYVPKAIAIMRRLIDLQDQDPNSPTYGIWPWFFEEPLEHMSPPDWNWADFCGKQLIQAVSRHGSVIPEELSGVIRQSIYCACDSIMKRDVGPSYTNIALMGAFVTLIAGEFFDEQQYADYGLQRLENIYGYTKKLGTFHEFNSPNYTIIAITELSKINILTKSERAKEIAGDLLDLAWRMVAEHFHPSTKQWSGPHSRSYHTLLTEQSKSFLQIATNNELTFPYEKELAYSAEWYGSGISCPQKYLSYFTDGEERLLRQLYSKSDHSDAEKWATTYMTTHYSVGVSSREIMWNQTRPMLLYVDNGGQAAYLTLRVLHDGYDYCSAVMNSTIDRNRLLIGLRFVTDGGDTHPSLDRIDGSIEASDLRIRIEVGGCLNQIHTAANGARAQVVIGETAVELRSLYGAFDHNEKKDALWKWELTRETGTISFDHILYTGEKKRLDFTAMNKAAFLYSLVLDEKEPEIAVEETDTEVSARLLSPRQTGHAQSGSELQLSIPLKPAHLHT